MDFKRFLGGFQVVFGWIFESSLGGIMGEFVEMFGWILVRFLGGFWLDFWVDFCCFQNDS